MSQVNVKMIAAVKADIPYPDDTGYDCQGYGNTHRLHKYGGCRYGFRPSYDEPRSDAECARVIRQQARDAAENEQVVACFNREPATDDNPEGGHNLRRLSHEESKCLDCGCVFFEPDF